MIIFIVMFAMYVGGWIMGFVTCSLSHAVNKEKQKLQQQRTRIEDLRPPRN